MLTRQLQSLEELFKGRHFEREIIVLCVRWYLRYKLSLRDLVEMMAERGLEIARTTILRGTFPSSRSAGSALPARPGDRGESGPTCIAPSTAGATRWTSG
jgi:hypothetical protein